MPLLWDFKLIIIMTSQCVGYKIHVARLKVTLTLCIGFRERCLFPAHNFILAAWWDFNTISARGLVVGKRFFVFGYI